VADSLEADVIIVGGGLAGIVTAGELVARGRRVLLLEKSSQAQFGGLAKESFGGVMMIDTPYQRRAGIKDAPEVAWRDWNAFAHFGPDDEWPRRWAKRYCEDSIPDIFEYCDTRGVKFLPVVNWPERGVHEVGNSVARWHITWGTGHELTTRIIAALDAESQRSRLDIRYGHGVDGFLTEAGAVAGVHGTVQPGGAAFEARAGCVVIASGGMCGGDLGMVRKHWYQPWGEPPEVLLNGAHVHGDGLLHGRAEEIGAKLTHLDKQWHYAAGVHHPAKRKPHDGLSLVPPRSALWVNALGERIRNPDPLVSYTDTRHLVESIVREPGKYSWQILNWKIAAKELAVSGSEHMTAFRNKSKLLLLKHVLLGNHALVKRLVAECPDDFVVAGTLPELVEGMNRRNLFGLQTSLDTVRAEVESYDTAVAAAARAGRSDDFQIQTIMEHRKNRGDRIRLCKFQRILDKKAMPLIAIREFILARKSLGGIQTDLECRVLRDDGTPIPGLYAVGEAAGFGGGGIHGLGSLEGTFLGSCILTGRVAGRTIAGA
jgi:predicted oxidoreductase